MISKNVKHAKTNTRSISCIGTAVTGTLRSLFFLFRKKVIALPFRQRTFPLLSIPEFTISAIFRFIRCITYFLHFDHPFYFRFILRSASPAITQAQYRTTVLIAAMPRAIAMITVFIIWFLQSLRLISNCLVWTNSQIYNRKRIWRNTYRTPPHSFYD